MIQAVKNVKWDDFTEGIPAFLTLIGIPFTFSIADGLCFGFISYPLLKLLSGKGKTVSWLIYLLGVLSIARYLFLNIR
jgi:AGZA family xanthine/uracil permease-like MFS transporter